MLQSTGGIYVKKKSSKLNENKWKLLHKSGKFWNEKQLAVYSASAPPGSPNLQAAKIPSCSPFPVAAASSLRRPSGRLQDSILRLASAARGSSSNGKLRSP
jgi:hypothetical protein